ncbi:hypothetical protein Taro_056504 [Colocasia esculenta]|uniref:Uncharacterized protein n=1 Tax=Colocasia esculenta TaxID=4460 RepID=A0A843XWV7_COLES|nr:hypothetical protein [Colocasia esculenta]
MGITFCSVIGIAYKTPIQNRHLKTLVVPLLTQGIRLRFGVSPFPRFSRCNVSLDHVNPRWGNHTDSASHGDRKLCSTQHENSSPGAPTSPI